MLSEWQIGCLWGFLLGHLSAWFLYVMWIKPSKQPSEAPGAEGEKVDPNVIGWMCPQCGSPEWIGDTKCRTCGTPKQQQPSGVRTDAIGKEPDWEDCYSGAPLTPANQKQQSENQT